MLKYILSIIIAIVIGMGIGYYFGHDIGWEQAIKTSENTIDNKNTETLHLPDTNGDIVTGQADTGIKVGGDTSFVRINIYIRGGRFDEFWVEYGQDATNLNRQTERTGSGLGMIGPKGHGAFTRIIPESELQRGRLYFYRAVARKRNEVVYGGVAAFEARK